MKFSKKIEEKREDWNKLPNEDNLDNKEYNTHFDVLGGLDKVKVLKDYITNDYVLAHLSKPEKEYCTENLNNAFFVKELMDRLHTRGFKYGWNEDGTPMKNEDGSYKKLPLEEKEIQHLKNIANQVFQMFLVRSHMLAILSRNNKDNFLLKLLGHVEEEEKPLELEKEDKSAIDKIKDFFRGKKKGEEEEEGGD